MVLAPPLPISAFASPRPVLSPYGIAVGPSVRTHPKNHTQISALRAISREPHPPVPSQRDQDIAFSVG